MTYEDTICPVCETILTQDQKAAYKAKKRRNLIMLIAVISGLIMGALMTGLGIYIAEIFN